jgi:hypothetical protein
MMADRDIRIGGRAGSLARPGRSATCKTATCKTKARQQTEDKTKVLHLDHFPKVDDAGSPMASRIATIS